MRLTHVTRAVCLGRNAAAGTVPRSPCPYLLVRKNPDRVLRKHYYYQGDMRKMVFLECCECLLKQYATVNVFWYNYSGPRPHSMKAFFLPSGEVPQRRPGLCWDCMKYERLSIPVSWSPLWWLRCAACKKKVGPVRHLLVSTEVVMIRLRAVVIFSFFVQCGTVVTRTNALPKACIV